MKHIYEKKKRNVYIEIAKKVNEWVIICVKKERTKDKTIRVNIYMESNKGVNI